jgi:hypothetical protein
VFVSKDETVRAWTILGYTFLNALRFLFLEKELVLRKTELQNKFKIHSGALWEDGDIWELAERLNNTKNPLPAT